TPNNDEKTPSQSVPAYLLDREESRTKALSNMIKQNHPCPRKGRNVRNYSDRKEKEKVWKRMLIEENHLDIKGSLGQHFNNNY
ncbi:hypothetical protein A6R68_21781, partial [Neotoma lepida]